MIVPRGRANHTYGPLKGASRAMTTSATIIPMLEIAALALVLIGAAFGYVLRQALRSPRGYEDEDGFHFEPEPLPEPRAERWPRAGYPGINRRISGRIFHHRSSSPEDLGPIL